MKLSISLPEEDVEFLDAYAASEGIVTRSAAVRQAITALRATGLAGAYDEAFAEWDASEDATIWDSVVGDGLGVDAPR